VVVVAVVEVVDGGAVELLVWRGADARGAAARPPVASG
jgi:hypothetical protein